MTNSLRRFTSATTNLYLLFMLGLAVVQGQEPSGRSRLDRVSDLMDNLRQVNQLVLDVQAEAARDGAAQARVRGAGSSEIQNRAMRLLESRAELMRSLIDEYPEAALRLAFSDEGVAELLAQFPDAGRFLETHGRWEGPVETLVSDDPDMTEHRVLHNLEWNGRRYRIRVAGTEPEGLKCGDVVEFEGVAIGESVAAGSAKITSVAEASACSTTGDQRSVVLLVTFPGVAPPSGVTAQSVYNTFFSSTSRSVNGYWREASYNKASTSGDVFGWITLDAAYTCDQYYAMRDAAYRAVGTSVNLTNYTRVFILFPTPSGCSWAGMSNVGCSSQTSASGSFVASVSWMVASYFSNNDQGVKLATHEGGHALGLMHARSRVFSTTEPLGALGTGGTISTYGDPYSTMGTWNLGHYNAYSKAALSWQGSSNVLTVQGSGNYTIAPTEVSTSGPQTLKIQRGTGNNAWVWLEYRQPTGNYDNTLSTQAFTGALIHYQDSLSGSYTDLLDYNPGTSGVSDAPLAAGRTWTDPYSNVSLTINSATASGLNVSVNYGTAPCTRAAPTISASPTNPSVYAGNSVGYSVTIRNNDSSSCTANTFALASSAPTGWGTAFSAPSVTLAPGLSTTITMTKNVPAGTTPSTYGVNASATSASPTSTGSASCTVMTASSPITLTLSINSVSMPTRSTVSMGAVVRSGTAGVPGAVVAFRLVSPKGVVTTRSLTTNSTGSVTWSYKLNPNDPRGVWTWSATATSGTQTASSVGAAFTVY